MKIRNLTPHTINVFTKEREYVFPSEGVARVLAGEEPFGELKIDAGDINGIPVVHTTYGEITGLPEQEDGTINIVSYVVLNALKAQGNPRTDCVAPNSSPSGAIRDEEGRIVGVRGFQRI